MTERIEAPSATPADAPGAEARKAELMGNAEWAGRYLNGDTAARAEMKSLNEIIAGQAATEATIAEQISVDYARDRGVSEETIKHHLIDRTPISQAEHDAAVRWRQSHFGDPKWREAYMSGDMTARREAALSSILISSPIKPAA